MNDILLRLGYILEQRKDADPATSYVAGLYSKGTDAIVGKIAEEAAELVLAAKDENNHQIIYETADLWFHSLILLVHAGLNVNDVLAELDRRFGTSGLDEKAQRQIKT